MSLGLDWRFPDHVAWNSLPKCSAEEDRGSTLRRIPFRDFHTHEPIQALLWASLPTCFSGVFGTDFCSVTSPPFFFPETPLGQTWTSLRAGVGPQEAALHLLLLFCGPDLLWKGCLGPPSAGGPRSSFSWGWKWLLAVAYLWLTCLPFPPRYLWAPAFNSLCCKHLAGLHGCGLFILWSIAKKAQTVGCFSLNYYFKILLE